MQPQVQRGKECSPTMYLFRVIAGSNGMFSERAAQTKLKRESARRVAIPIASVRRRQVSESHIQIVTDPGHCVIRDGSGQLSFDLTSHAPTSRKRAQQLPSLLVLHPSVSLLSPQTPDRDRITVSLCTNSYQLLYACSVFNVDPFSPASSARISASHPLVRQNPNPNCDKCPN